MSYICGIGTAAPVTRYTQAQCWEALRTAAPFARLDRRAQATLQKVLLGDSGVAARALALDPLSQAFDDDPDTLHARYARHAPVLASRAASAALERSRVDARAIDAVLISTCTGYLCPGLSSYVMERLGLREDVVALDLVGQGCAAALPNLAAADALIASGRCAAALSVCVEVCSAAYYLDDDPGVLVSACLFADGAGAAVLTRDAPRGLALQWRGSHTLHAPQERDALRLEQRAGRLRNILTPRVPGLAAEVAQRVLETALAARGLSKSDIAAWVWHAGGKRVLGAVAAATELDERAMATSRAVLSDCGNLSSAFVYFVLDRTWRAQPRPGWWWMSSFGAGFSCHGALLRAQAA